jgi:RHS repeat-associated protein
VSYTTNDHLGSPRINTNANGEVMARHDYQPFGEEISRTGYGSDEIRKQFTGYERDKETNLDFAQARYFNSGLGRFSSPDDFLNDTHVSDPQSWNLYVYVRNNPLRFVDPSGMVTGDYYDQAGTRLGTDGINDGKTYVVTNNQEVETIRNAAARNVNVSRDQINSELELPSLSVRQEIGINAVARSNAATSTERGATDGFAETGGVVIQTANGQLAVPAVRGAMGDPRINNGAAASINVENPADPNLIGQTTDPSSWVTTYHIHPSGEIRNNDGSISSFNQPPSDFLERVNGQQVRRGDIPNAANPNASPVTLGYRIVVGAGRETINNRPNGGQRVYFYNGSGVLGSMPLNRFTTINTPVR